MRLTNAFRKIAPSELMNKLIDIPGIGSATCVTIHLNHIFAIPLKYFRMNQTCKVNYLYNETMTSAVFGCHRIHNNYNRYVTIKY